MSAPTWLQDEPEIRALLGAALDRFDDQPGEQRSRATSLKVQSHLPSLARGDEQADHTWALVQELATAGVLEIRPGRRGRFDPDWQGAKLAFAPACEPVLRDWLQRPATASPMDQWRRAVAEQAHLFPAGCEALLGRRIVVPGRSDREIVTALTQLASITQPATLRQLSTLIFWGASKVLDDRGELIAQLFPNLQIRERPIVVAVHLPARIEGVLFIENQDNYGMAISGELAGAQDLAIVYLHGFRGTAARIRNRQGVHLHFGGPGIDGHERFEGWWFDDVLPLQPLFFWGDLDFASMTMLKSLRQRFGEVTAWRPGYEPMVAALAASGGGNRPTGHQQVDPVMTGCPFADEALLPAVRTFGCWDQERMAD
ncbi:MAG TPA: hypothetical protein VGE08_23760 [Steroidobacter sp.]|uniref:hypothetical protein n=1 Tax=Steroidobacter sp. TaxID=1978227 RepID=UPI002ED8F1BC